MHIQRPGPACLASARPSACHPRGSYDLEVTSDQEALGLAGSIHKRRWRATGQKNQLELSYHYYRRGCDVGPSKDNGYTAINAAFVLDQLTDLEATDCAPAINDRRAEAKRIREALVDQVQEMLTTSPELAEDWWYLVTIAEAFFGLDRYDDAEVWLTKAKALPNTSDWEFRTTASQLATLHQLQHPGTASPNDPGAANAARVLDAFVDSAPLAKARLLAKWVWLCPAAAFARRFSISESLRSWPSWTFCRRVEVLSCVSGGSIVGAHYYLQLRETLETTDLERLTEARLREIFIEIVQDLAADFLAGVQTNMRMRVFANPFPLLRSVVDRAYTRTTRLGELFERQLFAKIWAHAPAAGPIGLCSSRR